METQALKQESAEWVRSPESTSKHSSPTSNLKSTSDTGEPAVVTREKAVDNQADRVSLSQQARSLQEESLKQDVLKQEVLKQDALKQDAFSLTPSDQEFLTRLQARDNEVKMHEASHLASAGQYATSGANYTYQEGPNGKQYAIGGEVGIDVSPVADDPEATISKADTIVQAALSPASPSPQDFKVADQARQMRMQAVRELAIEEAQNQQADRKQSAAQEDEKIQKTQTQLHEEQKVESKKEALKQTENKQADVKAEIERLQNNQQTNPSADGTTTDDTDITSDSSNMLNQPMTQSEQDQQAKEQEDKRVKEEADRLASLNQLFARYDEARKTYQAIVDFFTSQYEQSQKGQNRIELFA